LSPELSSEVARAPGPPPLVDSHAHIGGYGQELPAVLSRAKAAGVLGIVAVGTDAASSRGALELARTARANEGWPRLAVSAGLHPHDASRHVVEMSALADLLAEAKGEGLGASVGETGLDYYRDLSPRPVQRAAFWAHIELAHTLALPLIVHDRDAHADVLAILRGAAPFPAGVVLHCFSGDLAMAEECVALGFYISFAGPLTFPSAASARAIARDLPGHALLVETDCPYLAPVPHRGKRNEPAYVVHTVAALAAARREPVAETVAVLARNACGLWFPGSHGFTSPAV
jgi:TatD DNase family protein